MSGAEVLTQDQLFSTVDPTVRRRDLPGGWTVLLSDTVGFVRRLPHHLVEAFRSTLEEVAQADLLLHVADGSAESLDTQIGAVRSVLADIDAGHLPEILVLNKADRLDATAAQRLSALYPEAVIVSALEGEGLALIDDALRDALRAAMAEVELSIPYGRGDVVAAVHREGRVVFEKHLAETIVLRALLPPARADAFSEFATG